MDDDFPQHTICVVQSARHSEFSECKVGLNHRVGRIGTYRSKSFWMQRQAHMVMVVMVVMVAMVAMVMMLMAAMVVVMVMMVMMVVMMR
jgi:hypothetical protein